MISKQDAADLSWYLGEGLAAFERSSFGPMLEKASVLSVDSTGKQIERCDRHSWAYIQIKHTPSEPSYTPELATLIRVGSVSRRLARVERADALSAAVLGAYYGDIGARWGRTQLGRVAALYALTRAGREHVAQAAQGAREHVMPDDRIALAFVRAREPSNAAERELCARVDAQARKLLRRAWAAWQDAGAGRG